MSSEDVLCKSGGIPVIVNIGSAVVVHSRH